MKKLQNIKILLIPLMVLLMVSSSFMFMIFFGYRELEDIQYYMPLKKILAIITHVTVAVILLYFWVKKLNKVLPWNKIWLARFGVDAGTVLLFGFTAISVIRALERANFFPPDTQHFTNDFVFIMPLMFNTIHLTLIELILAYQERNNLEIQLAKVEQLHISSQYKALKEQLDHHFLFNNLSVLSSIIYENVEKADMFIQKLSSVYRYVLSINQQDLISLEDELEFIQSYLDLFKFRFEDGFSYDINVDKKHSNCQIPPLTLQVLVENTVKHNVVSRSQALHVKVYTQDDLLIVENNKQLRESKMESTHTGLQNLIEKYNLLGINTPIITNTDKNYKVAITLISQNND